MSLPRHNASQIGYQYIDIHISSTTSDFDYANRMVTLCILYFCNSVFDGSVDLIIIIHDIIQDVTAFDGIQIISWYSEAFCDRLTGDVIRGDGVARLVER